MLGYAFARSVRRIDSTLGRIGIVLFVAVAIALVVFVKRTERRLLAQASPNHEGDTGP